MFNTDPELAVIVETYFYIAGITALIGEKFISVKVDFAWLTFSNFSLLYRSQLGPPRISQNDQARK